MSLNLTRKDYRDELAWLASHRSAQYKTGGITLSHIHRAQDPRTGKRIYRSGEFVGLLSPAAAGLFGRYVRLSALNARLVTDAGVADAGIVWTARNPGTGGNNITLALVDTGVADAPLTVAVAANAITVQLSNDDTPAINTTADQLIAAIEADDDARALVYGERARGHNGSGLVTALGATNLAGGLDATGTQAELVTDDIDGVANTDITYTAKQLGADGNNMQMEYVADISRPNMPIHIDISGDGTAGNPYVFTLYYAMDTGTAAALTTGDIDAVGNTSIVYTAVAPGEAGDNIQIEYVDRAGDEDLEIQVVGAGTVANPYIIRVLYEVAGGAAQSTAAEIIDAVNNHFLASQLVSAEAANGDDGVPLIDYGPESLVGGVDPVPVSTAENIVDAINSHYFTSQLIKAEATDGDDGIPLIDYGPEALTGGADPNVSMDEGEFGILMDDVDVSEGNAMGALLWGGKVLDARLPAASDEFVRAALPKVAFTTENAP